MDNIILIGMPASGKSTAGVLLAKYIGYDFVDTDLLLQRESGAVLSDIISGEGADGFIAREQSCILKLDCKKTVIATGGSAVYGEKAMAHLKTLGKIIYIKVDFEELSRRLAGKDIFSRGVVMKRRGESFKELFDERAPLYEKYADAAVNSTNLSLEETVEALVTAVLFPQKP